MWYDHSNKKVWSNKSQKKHQSNKKSNVNLDTKSKNGVHVVDGKCMCLCNEGFGFNTSHATGFHDTWAACVQNNQSFTLSATHVVQKKIVVSSGTVPQVVSNHLGGNQALPTMYGGTAPAPF